MATVTDLRRIEFARGRRPLSNELILGDRFGSDIAARRHNPPRRDARWLRRGQATTKPNPSMTQKRRCPGRRRERVVPKNGIGIAF